MALTNSCKKPVWHKVFTGGRSYLLRSCDLASEFILSRVLLRSFRRVCAKVPSILILLPFFVAGPAVAQTTSLVANPDTAVVEKDSSVVIHVVGNDTGPTGSVTIETNVSPQAKRGWLSSDHASGTITYNPYNAQVGRDEFGYQLRGADGSLSNPTTVSVAIGNPPPLADCEPAGSANRHVSLLLVGNSLMNDVQSKLDILFSCGGYTFDIATSNPGGSFLHQHHTHEKTTNLIARYNYSFKTKDRSSWQSAWFLPDMGSTRQRACKNGSNSFRLRTNSRVF